jgi:hypothetical protein
MTDHVVARPTGPSRLEFFATATHPALGLPCTRVGYQPARQEVTDV